MEPNGNVESDDGEQVKDTGLPFFSAVIDEKETFVPELDIASCERIELSTKIVVCQAFFKFQGIRSNT